jgi:gliding motility-associated-like protein
VTDFIISEPDAPLSVAVDVTDILCFGDSNGKATVTTHGGTAPYTYDWTDMTNGGGVDPDVLLPGDYYLWITDANGCFVDNFFTVTQPDELSARVTSLVFASCEEHADGSVTLEATGGTSPYLYDGWASNTVESLSVGSYLFEITDAHGCTTQVPESIDAEIPMRLTTTYDNATCAGGNANGMVGVTAEFDTPGYTYDWSPGYWETDYVYDLPPDTYTVTVTDARGCQAEAVAIVEGEICDELALVPTAISPNGDGANDTFRVLADDVSSIELTVYDMFGKPLFSTTDVKTATETGWDGRYQGKDVPAGWYIWTVQGTRPSGRALTPEGGQRGRLVLSR